MVDNEDENFCYLRNIKNPQCFIPFFSRAIGLSGTNNGINEVVCWVCTKPAANR